MVVVVVGAFGADRVTRAARLKISLRKVKWQRKNLVVRFVFNSCAHSQQTIIMFLIIILIKLRPRQDIPAAAEVSQIQEMLCSRERPFSPPDLRLITQADRQSEKGQSFMMSLSICHILLLNSPRAPHEVLLLLLLGTPPISPNNSFPSTSGPIKESLSAMHQLSRS